MKKGLTNSAYLYFRRMSSVLPSKYTKKKKKKATTIFLFLGKYLYEQNLLWNKIWNKLSRARTRLIQSFWVSLYKTRQQLIATRHWWWLILCTTSLLQHVMQGYQTQLKLELKKTKSTEKYSPYIHFPSFRIQFLPRFHPETLQGYTDQEPL